MMMSWYMRDTVTGMNSTMNTVKQMEKAGLVISGTSPDGRLVEMVELPGHPWFLAVQFHPEFTSRPNRPQPLFREFVKASVTISEVINLSIYESLEDIIAKLSVCLRCFLR